MYQQDLQWWTGAIGAALGAILATGLVEPPWNTRLLLALAAFAAFSAYKITPGDSVKK